ncbi:MAG: hypothetical protein DRO11_03680 [Methanobacteriota archaeon]|nr:MAG: hypothetical protein DRO11_03680 [Euryarchaeota archaeon]
MSDNALRKLDPVGWLISKIQAFGFEYIFNRYYGLYKGLVVANNDPETRLRCRVMCPAIGHQKDEDVAEDYWALPKMNGFDGEFGLEGMFEPPPIGAGVWVEFEGGDVDFPVYSGGWLRKDYVGIEEFGHEEAKIRGIRTGSGSYLKFNEESDKVSITIAKGDGEGGVSGSLISLMDNGSVLIANDDGAHVNIDKENELIVLMAKDGSNVAVGKDSIIAMTASGAFLNVSGEDIDLTAMGELRLNAGGAIITNSMDVRLGQMATEPAVRGLKLMLNLATHIHPTTTVPGAPTGPSATPPIANYNELSEIVKIG